MEKRILLRSVKRISCILLTFSMITFQACVNTVEDCVDIKGDNPTISTENLNELGAEELREMKEQLQTAGIEVSDIEIQEEDASTRGYINERLLRVIKVTTKSQHPADPNKTVDLSGVLLVPKKTSRQLRLVVAPVPTYTHNDHAPSKLFQEMSLFSNGTLNYLYFWTLQAHQGFAVLLPDYPGYGDSYQQCFIPYLVQKPMVKSTIDLTKAAQQVLTNEGYKYKSEIIATGYSQGAFVATALARELDTNSSHNLPIKLLVAGGTPANLKYIAETVISSEEFNSLYLMAYAICGYHSNGYSNVNISDILKEPYASEVYNYFDGTQSDFRDIFPCKISDLFTQDIIDNFNNSKYQYLRNILEENSIQPWKNKCKMTMVHGTRDITVDYENAKCFAQDQKDAGGKITFVPVPWGNHVSTAIQYYSYATASLLLNR